MIYKFKSGHRFRKECDPQQIGENLEAIRVTHGGQLQVADVLTEAVNPASPLHPVFTWDNVEAAGHWREQEARQLIRTVVVARTEDAEPEPAFWNVKLKTAEGDTEQYYQSVLVLEQSPREYQAALTLLLGQINALDHSIKDLRRITPPSQVRQVEQASGFINRARDLFGG